MASILHEINVSTSPEDVFQALSTSEGLGGWWTADSEAEPCEGGSARFGFNGGDVIIDMEIEVFEPGRELQWCCVGGPDEWLGTIVTFELTGSEDGGTALRLIHRRWDSTGGTFNQCDTTWARLMHVLKAHVEGDAPGPMFAG
jgi:uncharacterized protein YndB with AHSA1/START domain